MVARFAERPVRTVVWDFNGTLIDDLDLVLRAVNRQLQQRNLDLLTIDGYRSVFGFPVSDYYRRIGLDVDGESMAGLSAEFFAAYEPGLKDCPLHEGIREALERFSRCGLRQFVLSAMEEQMLRGMLAHLRIDRFFEAAYGLAHLEGDSKLKRGRNLVGDHGIDPAEAMMIGDTNHDAEVAITLGMTVALVATGHQSFERLVAAGHPVYPTVGKLVNVVCGPHDD
jgi:phosphoglycolate phosphatase